MQGASLAVKLFLAAVILCASAAQQSASPLLVGHRKGWHVFPGHGTVKAWAVNDTVNRVRVAYRSGAQAERRLRQYEFQNGDHFFHSALVIGDNLLVVTHQHGAFEVNDKGKVVAELGKRPPVDYNVVGHRRSKSKYQEGEYDYWLYVRGWNGKTIAATSDTANPGYFVLLTRGLRRTLALTFVGGRITTVKAAGSAGWFVQLIYGKRRETVRVGNAGRLSWNPRTACAPLLFGPERITCKGGPEMAVTNYHAVDGEIVGETTSGVRTDCLLDALGSATVTVNQSAAPAPWHRFLPRPARRFPISTQATRMATWLWQFGRCAITCTTDTSDTATPTSSYHARICSPGARKRPAIARLAAACVALGKQ